MKSMSSKTKIVTFHSGMRFGLAVCIGASLTTSQIAFAISAAELAAAQQTAAAAQAAKQASLNNWLNSISDKPGVMPTPPINHPTTLPPPGGSVSSGNTSIQTAIAQPQGGADRPGSVGNSANTVISSGNTVIPSSNQSASGGGSSGSPGSVAGSQVSQPSPEAKAELQKWKDNPNGQYGPRKDYRDHINNSDRCATGAQLGNYGCDGTYMITTGAQTAGMMGQMMGAMGTTAAGNVQTMNAMASQSQTGALQAAANTAETTGYTQMGLATMNGALGALQIAKFIDHKNKAKKLGAAGGANGLNVVGVNEGQTGTGSVTSAADAGWVTSNVKGSIADKAIERFELNENGKAYISVNALDQPTRDAQMAIRVKQGDENKNEVGNQIRRIAQNAASENDQAANVALNGGLMNTIQAVQQGMSAGFALAQASRLKKAIKDMGQTPTPTISPAALPNLPGSIGEGNAYNAPGAVSSDAAEAQSPVADASPLPAGPDLGTGFNPDPLPSGLPEQPIPGRMMAGNPGMGGAPPAFSPGGSTAPAEPQQPDPQPLLSENSGGTNYSSGGSFLPSGGGGKGAEGGPDLSGLLSKFLPQKDEEKPSSIMEFGKAGETEGPYSLLGPNVNLFERVTTMYREKQSKGNVGI